MNADNEYVKREVTFKEWLDIHGVKEGTPEYYNKVPINLSEYDLVFLYKKDNDLEIIRCSLEEFYDICSGNIIENFYERQYHILTPTDKQRLKMRYNKNHINYIKENTKKWKDKIGDMDIAQYHMLIYGE